MTQVRVLTPRVKLFYVRENELPTDFEKRVNDWIDKFVVKIVNFFLVADGIFCVSYEGYKLKEVVNVENKDEEIKAQKVTVENVVYDNPPEARNPETDDSEIAAKEEVIYKPVEIKRTAQNGR